MARPSYPIHKTPEGWVVMRVEEGQNDRRMGSFPTKALAQKKVMELQRVDRRKA